MISTIRKPRDAGALLTSSWLFNLLSPQTGITHTQEGLPVPANGISHRSQSHPQKFVFQVSLDPVRLKVTDNIAGSCIPCTYEFEFWRTLGAKTFSELQGEVGEHTHTYTQSENMPLCLEMVIPVSLPWVGMGMPSLRLHCQQVAWLPSSRTNDQACIQVRGLSSAPATCWRLHGAVEQLCFRPSSVKLGLRFLTLSAGEEASLTLSGPSLLGTGHLLASQGSNKN